MGPAQYNVVSSYELMDNHIAAAVIDSAKSFSAHLTPAGVTVLLSIGSDSIFRASAEVTGTQTGWAVADISPLLSTKYPTATTLTAHKFAASGSLVAGDFAVLLAVTVTNASSSFDEMWLLTGPPGTDASSWLINWSSIIWVKLPYDAVSAPPIQSITAPTLSVTDLFLEHGLGVSDPTLAMATVADPGAPNELRCFLLNLFPGATPKWSYYQQEQNIGTESLAIVPGRMTWDSSWGLYKLYALDGQQSLTYLPTQGTFGPPGATLFTVPSGATAFASLVFQPSDTISYTDLFVAANGFIGYFPYDQGRPHEAIPLITSPLVTGVVQLHAVNCGGKVVIWGLNGSDQLFYTTAPLDERRTPSAWQAPIALLSHTTDIASLAGGAPEAISLFAIAPLGSTTATGNTGSGLVQLSRNASTGAWVTTVHPLPSTVDCITLKTYTMRVLVLDANNVPQAATAISVNVSSDCSLIINGASTPVSASDTLSLATDASGYLNLVHAVSSLATPSLTLKLPDGSLITIDPTGSMVKKLSELTSPDTLSNAKYVDASGKTQNLVAAGAHPQVVTGASGGLQAVLNKLPSLPRTATSKTLSKTPILSASQDSGLLSDLGDLVQWVGNIPNDIASIQFKDVEDAFLLVVAVAEDEFQAVVQTVEDGWNAITTLFKWIGAEIEAAFRYLALLFEWSDFITVKNTLKNVVNQSLTSFESIQSTIQASGDSWFEHAKANILPNLSTTAMAKPPSDSLDSAWSKAQPPPSSVGSNGTDLRSDTRLGWLKERVNTAPSTSSSNSMTAVSTTTEDANPLKALSEAITNLVSGVLKTFKTVFDDVGKLVSGTLSASDFFESVLSAMEQLGLDALQTVFDALMSAFKEITSSIQSAFNMPIHIPIISALYKDVTGSDLTLLDVVCLFVGIGLTLVYKIATGESPAAALASITSSAIDQTFTDKIMNTVKSPPTNSKKALVASKAMVAGEDPPDALQKVTGALLIVQSITLTIEGGAEMMELTSLGNVVFLADLTTRALRGLLEVVDDGAPMKEGGTQIKFELIWSPSILAAAAYILSLEGWESEFVEGMGHADACVSLIWGIWHSVDIHTITEGGEECPVGLTGEAIIELLEPLQLGATLSENPEAAAPLLILRTISAVVAGAARLQ